MNRKHGLTSRDFSINANVVEPIKLKNELELEVNKKTATIFAHILWDATYFYGDSIFDDYEQWLIETIRLANRNDAVNWIIKLHPVECLAVSSRWCF